MYYPENLIEEIRQRSDIADVIAEYVKLEKRGGTYFGLCPFHNEKTPSFSVTPRKQMYYCFGCGEGGNVISFIMKYENFSFVEAVKLLAERSGIALPEVEYSREAKEAADLRSILLEINKEAAKYYHYQLKTPKGSDAYKYFLDRSLTDEIITKFGLGFSNRTSDDLYKYLKSREFSDSLLKESGLVSFDNKGGYDRFHNRAMFPIMDVRNRVIGFGGRVMGEGMPKYLNSPETKIFDKSRNLYGLNFARASRKPDVIICEGYMDVITLHQAGFTNAVASLGTSLTSGHAMLLRRYTKQVLLAYDSDTAGIKAAVRAIPILKGASLSVKVIDMTPYKDPDEFIRNLGKEEFAERINKASNSFLFEVRVLKSKFDLADPEEKTSFYNELAKKLLEFEDELERNNYTEAVAHEISISYESLKKLVNKTALTYDPVKFKESPVSETVSFKKEKDDGIKKSQRILLTWLTEDEFLFEKISDIIDEDDFIEPVYHKVAAVLFEQLRSGSLNPAKILNNFENEEENNEAASLFNEVIPGFEKTEKEKLINDAVIKIKRNSLDYHAGKVQSIEDLQKITRQRAKLQKLHITVE
ncbi:DNA primase [Parasporobacterium paucivorans]|uniref:DNA primase n=1 Tax=Parasporobacterium paucivorans DSM 15970 TaxID=1122934 RepID=A0A1M6AL33_9FIRM|nr:DNA primase [Parasporobacterium paucivorans]SHI37214.1 DNA primase [Parasporobacterium paucivorans DSM 15970]